METINGSSSVHRLPPIADHSPERNRLAYLGILGISIAVAATFTLLLVRAPQTFFAPQLWAEDGTVFLVQEKLYGIQSFLIPYAGYFQLYSRLTAFLVAPFGAIYAPDLYAAGAVMATLWSAATIASVRAPFAWLFGALLMIPPHSGEIFGDLTNAQWMMAPALAFALATPAPDRQPERNNQLVFVAIAGLNGPFSILAIPLCLRRLAKSRQQFDWRLCGICLTAAAVQGAAMLLASPGTTPGHSAPFAMALVITDRTIGQLMHGSLTHTVFQSALVLLGVVVVVAGVLNRKQSWPLSLLLYAVLILAATWMKFRHQDPDLMKPFNNGDRYFFVPRLIIIWIMIDVLLCMRWISIFAALSLLTITWNVHHWKKPALPLLEWRSQAWKIDRGEPVRIVINPSSPGSRDGWVVSLPRIIP